MIKNDALSDKLNNFKNKGESPENEPKQSLETVRKIKLIEVGATIYTILAVVFKSIMFGYSAKIIFSTSWNLLETICIGLSFSFLLTFLYDLIRPS